jgi:hypothetical protein
MDENQKLTIDNFQLPTNSVGTISEINNCSLMGWFIYKSENIPDVPDLGNASEGKRELNGSGFY